MRVIWVVSAAVVMGVVLLGYVLREKKPPTVAALVHGGLGFVGLVWLLAVVGRLGSPARGTGGFGVDAAWLLSATLAGGLLIAFLGWRGRKPPVWLIALHAAAGVCGWVLLAAM